LNDPVPFFLESAAEIFDFLARTSLGPGHKAWSSVKSQEATGQARGLAL